MVFLEVSQNSQENTCARVSFLIKLQACNNIEKQTLSQVFSSEFCEISKNTIFDRTPQDGCFCKFKLKWEFMIFRVFVFPGPRSRPLSPAPLCIWRPQPKFVFSGPSPQFVLTSPHPTICIYRLGLIRVGNNKSQRLHKMLLFLFLLP